MKENAILHNAHAKDNLHALSPGRIELSKELFPILAETLNLLHHTDFSERFWKLVAEEYARSVIIRYDQFRNSSVDHAPGFLPLLSGNPVNFKSRLRGRLVNVKNYVKSRGERENLFKKLNSHDKLLVGFSADSLVAKDTGAVPLPDCALKPGFLGDRKKRDRLNKIADGERGLFKKNVLHQMPGYLVEHFSSIYEGIELVQPEKKTFHVHGKYRFSLRQIVMAKYAEYGSRMIWYQNGAMVGECKYKYGGYLVRSVADEHRTWGWKMDDVDLPWKAYDLQQFKDRYIEAEKQERDDLLITYPKLWGAEDFYMEMTQKFLKLLDQKLYKSVRIRPYPYWKSGSGADTFQRITAPRVTVSSFEESMAEEVANTRIVLHIHVPATSFLESVSVDHPTTGLLKNEHPTDIVKPHYEDFLGSGVLHTEIESVAEHLNNAKIDQWWNQIVGSKTYEQYKKLFTGA